MCLDVCVCVSVLQAFKSCTQRLYVVFPQLFSCSSSILLTSHSHCALSLAVNRISKGLNPSPQHKQTNKHAKRNKHRKSKPAQEFAFGQFQANKKPAMDGDDDDEDPYKRCVAILPSDSLIQHMRVNANAEGILAPLFSTNKLCEGRLNMFTRLGDSTHPWFSVTAISGRSCPSRKFLPVQMTHSTTKVEEVKTEEAGIQQVDVIEVGGFGLLRLRCLIISSSYNSKKH